VIATNLVTALEGIFCEEWLRILGLSSVERRRLRCNHIALYSFLRRGSGKGGAELYCLVSSDRTRGNSSKLCQWRFRLDVRKRFFTKRMIKHWNRISREVVSVSYLSVFQRLLDKTLKSMLQLLVSPEVVRQLNQMIFVGPFQLELFYSILFYSILFYSILNFSARCAILIALEKFLNDYSHTSLKVQNKK